MAYDTLASKESVTKTIAALGEHNFHAETVKTREEALARVKELIPEGASVMNGASRTLEEIGYPDYLKEGKHGWKDFHADITAENDEAKRAKLRRESVTADFYLGSAHAVTEEGELFFASNSGSQLPHLAFTSPNVILIVGTHKIVPDLAKAADRVAVRILPLEEVNMQQKYGVGTQHNKTLILHNENPMMGRTVRVIFVEEVLGF
jgi:L-lactate utilization protein LutB